MNIAIHGATGKMGRAIVRLVQEGGRDRVVGAVAAVDAPEQGRDIGELAGVGSIGVAVGRDVSSALLGADVCIDFSVARAAIPVLRAAARAKLPLVLGTTGLDASAESVLAEVVREIPVLWAANMSFGVEILAALVRSATRQLGLDYDVEIVETHHKMKVDAPSGTALRLADAVRTARADLALAHGRSGQVGARKPSELGMHAVRGGDVIGDHSVHFFGSGERIELTHRATSRDLFASGAVRAARWLLGKHPGRYALSDTVLSLPPT